ncbi:MAG TPA: hypothetical protein VN727_06390, partial [Candidatus Binatia bacterium]|nr:hypothetical protein [Candidatus Binatia bacterium]
SLRLSQLRDSLCSKLRMSGVFVLRHGEIEDYVSLGNKGKYLDASREIADGIRQIDNQADFETVVDGLQTWAAPPLNARAGG